MKKKLLVIAVVVAISIAGAVFAYAATPAEIVSDLTGLTQEEVTDLRASGSTYGKIAQDEGKFEEFKAAFLEARKERLAQMVEEGRITQERADEIIETISERIASCDGSFQGASKGEFKMGFGAGQGLMNGSGDGKGFSQAGQGMRRGNRR